MNKFLLAAVVCLYSPVVFSQSAEAENIIISQSRKEYKFVKGNDEYPVQVKEKSSRVYYCNNYRAEIPVVEFYNDMERIDDVDILVDQSKKHSVVPKNEYYSSSGIFYSDARVCYFSLPLLKKGATSKVSFTKTILDPKYFGSIHFTEPVPMTDQEVKVIIPSWMKVELKEYNFQQYNITRKVITEGDNQVYIYTMANLPGMKKEPASPGFSHYAPHILVLSKSAESSTGKITYFNTLKDQYAWYRKLIKLNGNAGNEVKEKMLEITKGSVSEEDKVKKIYQWVQDNIRYIAFENGIAGFKPEKAEEVLRKKYGDCKGMANLLTEMLRFAGVDARRCWIGTRDIAYDYSTPSLVVDNHMISVWMRNGKPVYLDATEKYIGFGEVAERIQGKQTLIENNDNYILEHVPVVNYQQNTDFEKRILSMDGSSLKGRVEHNWKGENKVYFLNGLNSIKQDKQETALLRYLSDNKTNYEISSLKITNLEDYNKDVKVDYNVNWKNAVTEFGDETYLEIDNRRRMESFRIDTGTRKLPYWFDFKNHVVFETELILPQQTKPSELPSPVSITRQGYSFSGNYAVTDSKLTYRCEIIIKEAQIRPEQFSQWNKDVTQLENFYNQQIVLKKTK